MAPTKAYSSTDLESFFSSSLGVSKAREVVERALHALGLPLDGLDGAAARRVLETIAEAEGLVGVTARVALARFEGGRAESSSGVRAKRRVEVIADLLAPTLGRERAESLVREQARAHGFPELIDLEQALGLLEHIAHLPGVTGIAARFAKTRITLSW